MNTANLNARKHHANAPQQSHMCIQTSPLFPANSVQGAPSTLKNVYHTDTTTLLGCSYTRTNRNTNVRACIFAHSLIRLKIRITIIRDRLETWARSPEALSRLYKHFCACTYSVSSDIFPTCLHSCSNANILLSAFHECLHIQGHTDVATH